MRLRAGRFLPGLLLAVLVAVPAGMVFGAVAGWATLALGFGVLLWRNYANLLELLDWAAQPRLSDPPQGEGVWAEVFDHLHRHRRANLRRRRELATLMVRTRRAVEALPYGVALLDGDNRLEWCNEVAQEHLGIDAERDRGQPVQNFVRQPEFFEYLASDDLAAGVVLRTGPPGGRSLSVQIVAVDDAARLLLSNDVTGAERLESMRRDFVANVSHELRTPLTVLAGFLETIRDLDLDAQRVHDYVCLMAPQAERMKRIIDDLLTLSSLEHAPAPAPERVRVRLLLDRVMAEARMLSAGRHQLSLQVQGEHDVAGADSEIASAFTNLVTNAIRYTPAGGEIRLAWKSSAEGAEFSVTDTGIGVPPEHVSRLTERFYRVDRSRSRETGGTGLGLSIVKHALARHNGVLEIDSEPGKGSCFTARFPATRLLARETPQKVSG
ncbi:MAG: phosphate regulon sensor histidine kinase PhoR [Burkholderiales bacterium]